MWRTASTTLPLPASPLVRIIAAPSPMRRNASPKSRQPQTKGHFKVELADVVMIVGRGKHFGLVDEIDPQSLQNLRFGDMADARFSHNWDSDCADDAFDHLRVGHTGYAAILADIGRDALQRHDRHSAGILGNRRLLSVNDVHDNATFEHFGQADFGAPGAGCGIIAAAIATTMIAIAVSQFSLFDCHNKTLYLLQLISRIVYPFAPLSGKVGEYFQERYAECRYARRRKSQ